MVLRHLPVIVVLIGEAFPALLLIPGDGIAPFAVLISRDHSAEQSEPLVFDVDIGRTALPDLPNHDLLHSAGPFHPTAPPQKALRLPRTQPHSFISSKVKYSRKPEWIPPAVRQPLPQRPLLLLLLPFLPTTKSGGAPLVRRRASAFSCLGAGAAVPKRPLPWGGRSKPIAPAPREKRENGMEESRIAQGPTACPCGLG